MTFVTTNGNTIPVKGQVDGSSLACSYTASEITLTYGGSGSGTGSTGGSVTVTDRLGKTYTITSKSWDELKKGH